MQRVGKFCDPWPLLAATPRENASATRFLQPKDAGGHRRGNHGDNCAPRRSFLSRTTRKAAAFVTAPFSG